MKKNRRVNVVSHRLRKRQGDTRELAAQLAPLEELVPEESKKRASHDNGAEVVAQENGAIVVGREKNILPPDVFENGNRKLVFEPVVLVIVGLMLVFTLFIAWQISRMP